MSEKINFEKIDYQDRVLNSKERFICEDWERGKGKTTTLLRKVLKPNTKVLWVTPSLNQFKLIEYAIEDWDDASYIKYEYLNKEKQIIVHLQDGDCILYNYNTLGKEPDIRYVGSRLKVDNVVIDDADIRYDLDFKNQLDSIIVSMLKENGQIINLYTSIRSYMKNNEKLNIRSNSPNCIQRKILCEGGWGYTKVVSDEILDKIKPGSRITIADYNSTFGFKYLLSAMTNDKLTLIRNDKAIYKFDNGDYAEIKYITFDKAYESIKGWRCTDLFILGIDKDNKEIKEICDYILEPFMIPNEKNKNKCSITNIYLNVKEKKTDRYNIINNQINILLDELNSTPKSSNTTITREKIINMIDKLYRIKELENK